MCERENLLLLLYFLLPCCKLNVQREWEREIRVDGAPRVPTHRLSKSIFSVLNKNRKTRTKECFTFISFVAIFLDQNLIFMENAFRSTLKGPFSRSQPWQYPIETPEDNIFSVELRYARIQAFLLAISSRVTILTNPIA